MRMQKRELGAANTEWWSNAAFAAVLRHSVFAVPRFQLRRSNA
jgi:hypothetical protein